MTAISRILEDFAQAPEGKLSERWVSDEEWEEQRLSGYEEGYAAGWDDALSAQQKAHSRLVGTLEQRLADISFTYHEALSQMIAAIEPLMEVLFERVLPAAWSAGIAGHLAELAAEMAKEQAAGPLVLTVPAGTAALLGAAFEKEYDAPFELQEDPDLGPDQALIRLGEVERQVDGAELLRALKEAVGGFMAQTGKEREHG